MSRTRQAVFSGLAAGAFAVVPAPNGVVSGSRPSPYGYCVPWAEFTALRQRHSLAVWLAQPMSASAFFAAQRIDPAQWEALRAFNRQCGLELPAGPDAMLPAGVPIWLPPAAPDAGSCCVWIWSSLDGWVSAQTDDVGLRDVAPTYAHAASDSGSISVSFVAVPVAVQREWQPRAVQEPFAGRDPAGQASLSPELQRVMARWYSASADGRFFSFSQWVGERSAVARTIVTLPIAQVGDDIVFAEPPKVHRLDAYGKETSPSNPTVDTTLLVLVSATGGALLAFLLFAGRRRWQGSTA